MSLSYRAIRLRRLAALLSLALVVAAGAVVLPGGRALAQAGGTFHDYADASLQIFGDNAGDFLDEVAVGDFDADGVPDLVVSAQFFDDPPGDRNGRVYLLPGPIGTGTNQVGALTTNSLVGADGLREGFRVAAGDLDGDGIDDVVWTSGIVGFAVDTIRFVPGGPDIFEPGTSLASQIRSIPVSPGTIPGHIAIVDLDGDGSNDLVYGSPLQSNDLGSNEVVILFGPFSAPAGGTVLRGNTAIIRGPTEAISFGDPLAAGDLTGDGQPDLAINVFYNENDDAVAVLPGPFRSSTRGRTIDFDDLNPLVVITGSSGIVALGIGDADLDGMNDLLIGRNPQDEVRLIPGRVLGPARFPFAQIMVGEIYDAPVATGFGSALAVQDYDGDGLTDVLVGAFFDSSDQNTPQTGALAGFSAADRGPRLHGVRPGSVIAGSGAQLEIRGQGFLNPTLVFRGEDGAQIEVAQDGGANGLAVAADSLGVLHMTLPDALEPGLVDVIVRTDIGEVTLEDAFTVEPAPPTTRSVTLARGWNLVGWTGNTPIADATATISGSFEALFTWDAVRQVFLSFRAGLPVGNTLSDLARGNGVWINAPTGGAWEQPAFTAARSVTLQTGFNLAMWTGPDATPVDDAIAGIADATNTLFTWEAVPRRFLRTSPGGPTFLNDPIVLDYGDGVWLNVNRPVTWDQPASAPDTSLPLPTNVAEAEAAVVFIDQQMGTGSGFLVSDTQILTNAHVVGGAATVTIRFMNGDERQGLVTAIDGALDVAVVEVVDPPEGVRRLDWESADVPVSATSIWAWGFPGGEIFGVGTSATVTVGIVSAIQTDDEFSFVQTDAAINGGNSGGPLILEDGRVVGINDFSVLLSGEATEGLNFAIDVAAHRDRIRSLLEQ